MKKKLTPESSSIASINYHEESQNLYVEFKNGRTYEYAGVPLEVAEALFEAESVGAHFASTIRPTYKGGLVP